MHKPPWLYEALPWTYACAGVLVMVTMRNGLALVSGGLLILTGLVVKLMRRRYRRETDEHVVLGTLNLPPPLRWKPALAVGDEVLDLQHRQLFALSNELIQTVARRKPEAALHTVLQELLAQLRIHHAAEDRVAADRGQALGAEHSRQHAALLARAEQQRERCMHGHIDADALVRYLVLDVVAGHVAAEVGQLAAVLAAPVRQRERTPA